MDLVLEYPLTPVPLVFGQLDGSMNKTTKSVIYDILDARVKSPAPRVIDALLVDGFFFLHVHGKQLPNTFGKVAKHILKDLCRTSAKRIDLVFDQILTPSIKDAERDRRCTTTGRDAAYNISGPNQVCPSNFIGELRNDNFKRAFVKFLVNAMEDDSFAEILGQKSLNITQDSLCYSFIVSDGKVIRRDEPALFSNHEEADTRLFCAYFHSNRSGNCRDPNVRLGHSCNSSWQSLEIATRHSSVFGTGTCEQQHTPLC
jgi:hypothetical protein